jgi:Protein of unknown function (DUF2934)
MRTNESNSPKRRTAPPAKVSRAVTTAAKPSKSAPKSAKTPKTPSAVRLDDDMIRARAYEIYVERGYHGDPLEDWLRAERELIQQTAS